MRILIDIGHPAHVHVFKHAIRDLESRGHQVLVTSRDKECTLELLDELGIEHVALSTQNAGGPFAMLMELVQRDLALLRAARQFKPAVLCGVGGIFAAHVGFLLSIPSVVFYDTENATLQNLLTYPLATRVVVPECYSGWTPRNKTARYAGYHELAYLHPSRFTPERPTALANGLAADRPTYLVRCVSWQASHDIGETGWSAALLRAIVAHLQASGKVLISSEAPLPEELEDMRYRGTAGALHHVMAECSLYVGESATMAAECAVLGTPALYIASTGRSYVSDLERRFGLARHLQSMDVPTVIEAIDTMLKEPQQAAQQRRARMLEQSIDVTDLVIHHLLCAADQPGEHQ